MPCMELEQSEVPDEGIENEVLVHASELGYKGNDPEIMKQCAEYRHLEDIWSEVTKTAGQESDGPSESVRRLETKYTDAKNTAQRNTLKLNKIVQSFENATMHAEKLAKQLLSHRLRGSKVSLDEIRELKSLSEYTTLNRQKIADLLENEEFQDHEFMELEQILAKQYLTIQSIYRNYARGNTMSSMEYWCFIKDCKLLSADLPSATVDLIFARSNWTSDEEESDGNPDRELIPSEFVESLLRIAAVKHLKTAPTISTRFLKLLQENVFPRAGKSDASKFRQYIYDPLVQSIFTKYRAYLERIFAYYAQQDAKTDLSKKHMDTINVAEFYQMCKDSSLIDNNFSIRNVNNIFACIQIDEDAKKSGVIDEKSQELVFPEFLEGIAALTAFKVSDPFVPLYMRIDQFLGEILIPRLQLIIRSLEKISTTNEKGSGSAPGTPLVTSSSALVNASGNASANTVFNTKSDRRLSRASEKV